MNKTLNKQQLQAVTHKTGPLLVIAGAGTGKTTVVTERIKYLLDQKLAKPSEVLAITFTDKAAFEMETRMDQLMPLGYSGINIFTFHGFCEYFLRQNAVEIGLSNGFKLMTELDGIKLFKKYLFDFSLNHYRPLGNPNKNIQDILTHFSRLKDEYVSPSDYLAWAKQQEESKYLELAKVYGEWEELKTKKGLMDFGDLIFNTVKVLQATKISPYKFILVDEYQDTNYAQNLLVELLARADKNITVVCDDDQSIYNWRGSSVANVMHFRKKFVDSKLVVLNENFRSTQIILDRAYNLITKNNPDRLEVQEKISKKLLSQSIKGKDITNFWAANAGVEADWVAETITYLHSKKTRYGEIAILIRANSQAESFLRALQRKGIPYQYLGSQKLFFQPEIRDLLSWLKVLVDPEDVQSWYQVLSMNIWKFDLKFVLECLSRARRENISVAEVIKNQDVAIAHIYTRQLASLSQKSAGQILLEFLQESGILKDIYTKADQTAANITKFMSKVVEFEEQSEYRSVVDLLDWVELSLEVGETPTMGIDDDWSTNNAVNILTYHGAKGLEFDTVFMVNLVSDRFPSRNRGDGLAIPEELIKEKAPLGDAHVQEERRLFYVGMTRAKTKLYFTGASHYPGNKREKKWSAFVQEVFASKDIVSQIFKSDKEIYESPKTTDSEKIKFSINKISHSQIETFQTCPVHYKAKYILKIPAPPKAASTFGNVIHAVMKQLAEDPTRDYAMVLKANWSQLGFSSSKHAKDAKDRALKFLKMYLAKYKLDKKKIMYTEQSFTFPIADNLFVEGKIDRVDELGNGKIRIIDYKTGDKIPDQKDVDKDLQLSIYALAASRIWGYNPEDIELALYYFVEDKLIGTTRNKDQLLDAEKEIIEVRDQIEKSDFACSNPYFCKSCDYQFLCSTTSPTS